MKNIGIVLTALLLLLFLLGMAGVGRAQALRKTETDEVITDLVQAEGGIQKNFDDAATARKKLEHDVLLDTERAGVLDQIGMDQERANAYKSDILNDIGYLKNEWGHLTRTQKDLVDEAQVDMD